MRTVYQLGWQIPRADGTAKKGEVPIYFRFRWFANFIASIIYLFGIQCWSIIVKQYSDKELENIKRDGLKNDFT